MSRMILILVIHLLLTIVGCSKSNLKMEQRIPLRDKTPTEAIAELVQYDLDTRTQDLSSYLDKITLTHRENFDWGKFWSEANSLVLKSNNKVTIVSNLKQLTSLSQYACSSVQSQTHYLEFILNISTIGYSDSPLVSNHLPSCVSQLGLAELEIVLKNKMRSFDKNLYTVLFFDYLLKNKITNLDNISNLLKTIGKDNWTEIYDDMCKNHPELTESILSVHELYNGYYELLIDQVLNEGQLNQNTIKRANEVLGTKRLLDLLKENLNKYESISLDTLNDVLLIVADNIDWDENSFLFLDYITAIQFDSISKLNIAKVDQNVLFMKTISLQGRLWSKLTETSKVIAKNKLYKDNFQLSIAKKLGLIQEKYKGPMQFAPIEVDSDLLNDLNRVNELRKNILFIDNEKDKHKYLNQICEIYEKYSLNLRVDKKQLQEYISDSSAVGCLNVLDQNNVDIVSDKEIRINPNLIIRSNVDITLKANKVSGGIFDLSNTDTIADLSPDQYLLKQKNDEIILPTIIGVKSWIDNEAKITYFPYHFLYRQANGPMADKRVLTKGKRGHSLILKIEAKQSKYDLPIFISAGSAGQKSAETIAAGRPSSSIFNPRIMMLSFSKIKVPVNQVGNLEIQENKFEVKQILGKVKVSDEDKFFVLNPQVMLDNLFIPKEFKDKFDSACREYRSYDECLNKYLSHKIFEKLFNDLDDQDASDDIFNPTKTYRSNIVLKKNFESVYVGQSGENGNMNIESQNLGSEN